MRPILHIHPLMSVLTTPVVVALGICVSFAQTSDSAPPNRAHLHHHYFTLFANVPARDRARRNPLETDPDAVAAGKKLFGQHCAQCHGTSAEGGKRAPSLREEEVQTATPGTLFWILTNGVLRRGMPTWSKLPEAERWQIITFIKSLPPKGADFIQSDRVEHATIASVAQRCLGTYAKP